MIKGRILSGMRPTGRLHIGHLSVLENWVQLQKDYKCFYTIVDWHALTTAFDEPEEIKEMAREMAAEWLAVGINPEKSVVFIQSQVPQHAELHLVFSMFTPLSWLERVPTYKEQVKQFKEQGKDITTYGFLGYPLLQAADILVYKADVVPVGEDQLPHLELCREIARRFNYLYKPVFPEPRAELAKITLLPGVDGRKMSKSYANDIALTADSDEIKLKINAMVTDPARIHKNDPGHPEICVVHKYHEIYSSDELASLEDDCRAGRIGCVACKKKLTGALEEIILPVREKKTKLLKQPGYLEDILDEGARQARVEAARTMEEVRAAIKI